MTGFSSCPGVRIPPSPPLLLGEGFLSVALLGLSCALPGCAERTLRVETDPPGARVWVDGVEAGAGPVEIPFTYYGARAIEARARGFRPANVVADLEPPLWSRFPLDLFLEGLLPIRRRDLRVVVVRLERGSEPPASSEDEALEAVLGRGKALRAWAPDRELPGTKP